MIYSSACVYAIRAATYLASRDQRQFAKLRDIAEAEQIPAPFLASILQRLVSSGVLRSARGPAGGYALARDPRHIALVDIWNAIDGAAGLEACAAGLGTCSDDMPCPLHDTWKPIRERIRTYLRATTLEQMAVALRLKRRALGRRG
jgi:Rrf2 family protein